jgi:hypothetical protein
LAELCGCGRPLHYNDPSLRPLVQKLVDELGPTVSLRMFSGTTVYRVPRHYIALHGIAAAELPALAAQYGWEQEPA